MTDTTIPQRDRLREDEFRADISALVNKWLSCETAITDARDLAYMILDGDIETAQYVAKRWLDRNGRSQRMEQKRAKP